MAEIIKYIEYIEVNLIYKKMNMICKGNAISSAKTCEYDQQGLIWSAESSTSFMYLQPTPFK